MKTLLISMTAAAAILLPTSVLAADRSGQMPQIHRHQGSGHSRNQPIFVDGQADMRHQHGDGAGGWYDYGAIDYNRSWEADSYNDWWHDRPDRAFPRWMAHNENCERIWWSGGGWRC